MVFFNYVLEIIYAKISQTLIKEDLQKKFKPK